MIKIKIIRKSSNRIKKVKETKVLKSESGIPYIYILNYEDSGFMIMSADERFVPVLAYVENGKNYSEKDRKEKDGFDFWLKQLSEMILSIQSQGIYKEG
jgi:hypothetical protein